MSNGYLVERQLEDTISLPLLLPVTRLEPDSQIILAVVKLSGTSQHLKHRWMQLKIVGRDPATPTIPTIVDSFIGGYAYGAIYDSAGAVVAGTVTVCTDTDGLQPPAFGEFEDTPVDIAGPVSPGEEEYTYRVVNNCESIAIQLVATGSWRVVLNEVT
jgi:hypothetical protein